VSAIADRAPAAGGGPRAWLRRRELVLHLAGRQLASTHRRTALGWSWPLMVQLAQLGVLVFLFGRVLRLDIAHYPTFVFSGLIFWAWLQSGVTAAAGSVTDGAALVREPKMPTIVLPLVAIAVTGFDLLIALPILLVMVHATVGLTWSLAFLPVLLVVQAALMAGLALLVSAAHVHVRDVKPLVGVIFLIVFYLTPVFYDLAVVPEDYRGLYDLNIFATLVNGYHEVFMEGAVPELGPLAIVAAVAVAVLAAGIAAFRRLSPGFVDEL
jgi:lipopolysaccharide transport system permease protein